MNRKLATGAALLTLIGAVPANAAPRHANRYQQTPVQQQRVGSGVKIKRVDAGSPADRAGMRSGDSIVGINGSPVNDPYNIQPFLAQGGGRALTIDVRRDGALVRLRATPRNGMLGYSYNPACFDSACATYDPPPYIPDPPIPTPPPDPPPYMPPPQ
jgi:membrane-associated protease RseP (regulator of RpoE activity)